MQDKDEREAEFQKRVYCISQHMIFFARMLLLVQENTLFQGVFKLCLRHKVCCLLKTVIQNNLRGWPNFIRGCIACFQMLRKNLIFETDCNLQAACSFNNNLFLFQGMLQCLLTIALFDRLQKETCFCAL